VLRRTPSILATIGVAVSTSRLAVVRNIALHQRRRSPEPRITIDPLPPPFQRSLLVDDDDDAPPSDPRLIQRPTSSVPIR
jgi:hypothetical protein